VDNEPTTTQQAEVQRLAEIRRNHGTISEPEYNESLERLGKSPTAGNRGHLRRLVSNVLPAETPPSANFVIDEEALVALAKSPTIDAFHKGWVKERHPGLSRAALHRALHSQIEPGLLAYIKPGKGGMEAFRRKALSCLWHATEFGEAWQTDVTQLPFTAVPPGRGFKNPVRVKLIAVIDDATRLIVGWHLVYCHDRDVKITDTAGVLIGAMHRYGVPDQVVMDNGHEFCGNVTSELMMRAGGSTRLTPRYRGESKGKIERFNRTVKDWLAKSYPSWTNGCSSSARYPVMGANNRRAPQHSDVEAHVGELINYYNTQHVHSALGMTPEEAYQANPAQLLPLELHRVLHLGPVHNAGRKDEFVDVHPTGVLYGGEYYTNLDPRSPGRGSHSGRDSLAKMIGSRHGVRVRPVIGDPSIIGIYDIDDRFVCIATRMSDISTELRYENRSLNDNALHTAEKAMGRAQAAIEADHPDPTDDEDPKTDRQISMETFAAERLGTARHSVSSRFDNVCFDDDDDGSGESERACILVFDDPDVELSIEDAIDVFAEWKDRSHQELYRLESTDYVVMYHPERRRLKRINRHTHETEYVVLTITSLAAEA
jgi:transposase InsO family protein